MSILNSDIITLTHKLYEKTIFYPYHPPSHHTFICLLIINVTFEKFSPIKGRDLVLAEVPQTLIHAWS